MGFADIFYNQNIEFVCNLNFIEESDLSKYNINDENTFFIFISSEKSINYYFDDILFKPLYTSIKMIFESNNFSKSIISCDNVNSFLNLSSHKIYSFILEEP